MTVGKIIGSASDEANEGSANMALTKSFRDTVKARAARDPAFKAGLYQEAAQAMLDGDLATARVLLRDFINATIGFSALAERMDGSEKSLMRMFSPNGNPHANNLLAVLGVLRTECRLSVTVQAKPDKRRRAHSGMVAAA